MPDIVLKDRDCNDVTHEGVVGVKMLTADGGTQKFLPGEAQEKTVELDFSAGDMEVIPDEGMLLTKVSVLKPENLNPENIVKDMVIAGIVGTHEGGNGEEELCLFVYVKSRYYLKTSTTSATFTMSITYPSALNVKILDVFASNNNYTLAYVPQELLLTDNAYRKTPTITESDGITKVSLSYTVTTTNSAYYLKALIMFYMAFTIPGFSLVKNDDGLILKGAADADLSLFQQGYSCVERATVYDFSEIQGSTSVTADAFYRQAFVTKVKLPPNLTTIGQRAFSYCPDLEEVIFTGNVATIDNSAFGSCSALKVVDMRYCTAVPSLTATYNFPSNPDLQIIVPAALYNSWKNATNWSSYADQIVAV